MHIFTYKYTCIYIYTCVYTHIHVCIWIEIENIDMREGVRANKPYLYQLFQLILTITLIVKPGLKSPLSR